MIIYSVICRYKILYKRGECIEKKNYWYYNNDVDDINID